MADAFASTYWWALALVLVALVVATPLLPKQRPAPVEEPGAPDAEPARDAGALGPSPGACGQPCELRHCPA